MNKKMVFTTFRLYDPSIFKFNPTFFKNLIHYNIILNLNKILKKYIMIKYLLFYHQHF